MWTLAYGDHEDRTPTHGYEATRQAAMQAFAGSWHREPSPRPAGERNRWLIKKRSNESDFT
jgi:hypothetical protein